MEVFGTPIDWIFNGEETDIPCVPLILVQFPQGVLPSLGPLRNEIEPTSVGHSVGKDT